MICIFNPEHDLCLANGGRNYVPPASARMFAAESCGLMGLLYPSARCISATGAATLPEEDGPIVPWGWDMTLKGWLLRQGVSERLLPSDAMLADWRELQHRTSWLPLQPHSRAVTTTGEIERMLTHCPDLVMKAPWSGSGRGLRWVSGKMTDHDRAWLDRVVRTQRCVIVEPRWVVSYDYALEYRIDAEELTFGGFSLFDTANGVYRGNRLLPDEEIASIVGFQQELRTRLERWLLENVAPRYRGPLGVDIIRDSEGNHHVAEINLLHTMGMIAHAYLAMHQELKGKLFVPTVKH